MLVSILPQAYFVEKVGGSRVDVGILVGAGQDPHTYEVTPRQMARFGSARVYFRVGLPVEDRILRRKDLLPPDLEVVDTRAGVRLLHEGCVGPHGGADPHIWLDPGRVKIQARTIAEALSRAAPAHAEEFRANLEAFLGELEHLDRSLADKLKPFRGAKMYVFHPAFGYFCDAYGLEQVAVEAEGKEPSPRELAGLIERARRDGVKALFVEPQFAAADAKTMAGAIGADLITVDPLPRDYPRELERLAEALADALGKKDD